MTLDLATVAVTGSEAGLQTPGRQITSDNPSLPVAIDVAVSEPPAGVTLQSIAHEGLPAEVARYLLASSAPATVRAYQGDIADFLRWGGSLPGSPMTVARYVADRAQRHKPATLMRRIVGIGRAHARRGLPDPTKSELVRAVLQGVRREHGGPQRRAQPLLPCDLRRMLGQLALDSRGLRDRALVLLGFAAALRRSELVSLDVDDLTFMREGMTVRVRRSKTDQVGTGRSVAVPLGQGEFCAVAAVQAWLSGAQLTSGPIFRSVSRAGSVSRERLSDQSVSLIVKALVAAIGLPPGAYSGHSLRAGLVTSAALMGVPAARIQQQTGHQSVAMMSRYVRDARPFDENAAGAVL